jgi:hypothetical protein
MNLMRRRMLQFVGFAATIGLAALALARDPEGGAELKLAMGPTSAAQKPGGPARPANDPPPTCARLDSPCATTRHRRRGAHQDPAVSKR